MTILKILGGLLAVYIFILSTQAHVDIVVGILKWMGLKRKIHSSSIKTLAYIIVLTAFAFLYSRLGLWSGVVIFFTGGGCISIRDGYGGRGAAPSSGSSGGKKRKSGESSSYDDHIRILRERDFCDRNGIPRWVNGVN